MAKKFETTVSFPQPLEKVYIAFFQAMQRMGLQITVDNQASGLLTAHNSKSYSTDGEDLTVQVNAIPGGGTNVTVLSQCTSRMQIFDFGKNKKNVTKLIEAAGPYL